MRVYIERKRAAKKTGITKKAETLMSERWIGREDMNERIEKVFLLEEAHKGFSQYAREVKVPLWLLI